MKPTSEIIVHFDMPKVLKIPTQSEEAAIATPAPHSAASVARGIYSRIATWADKLFGLTSLICLLAILVNVPVLQIAVLGYLLDSSAKIASGGSLGSGFIGLNTASKMGRWVLCTALSLVPLAIVGELWTNAHIIDPTSRQTAGLNTLHSALFLATAVHILSALSCGGQVRHFFWPLALAFALLRRTCRRFFKVIIKVVRSIAGKPTPTEASARNNMPPEEGLVPAIIWRKLRQRTLYTQSRDDTLEFLQRLQLPHFTWLGIKGFFGSAIWLLLPTVLLANANHPRQGFASLSILLGVLIAVPVFMVLPMLQIQFAVDRRLSSLFDVGRAWASMRRAPVAHLLALLLMLVLALPLFLLKIEKIPPELYWLLSVLFVVLGWPVRFVWGYVYHYAQLRPENASRKIRWPIGTFASAIAVIFAFTFFLTRYISWNGTLSLFENHVFLLPSPFWF